MTHKRDDCRSWHITFGGKCLNCGYDPQVEKVVTSKSMMKRIAVQKMAEGTLGVTDKVSETVPLTPTTDSKKYWLVTGCAGFIGSHMIQYLLEQDQEVVGLDNLTSGNATNMQRVKQGVTEKQWNRFQFLYGDVCNRDEVRWAMEGVDYVVHLAAKPDVQKSIENPQATWDVNVGGFQNVLECARMQPGSHVGRVVYASSAAVYGGTVSAVNWVSDGGHGLSPYAASKWMNEQQAKQYSQFYGLSNVGLRLFNVYGPRQNQSGGVIPRWMRAMKYGKVNDSRLVIWGDGTQTRDFVYVKDVVKALATAATTQSSWDSPIFNVGTGIGTTMNELFDLICGVFGAQYKKTYGPARVGDPEHSVAGMTMTIRHLLWDYQVRLKDGLQLTAKELE